ncbi:MAG: DNA polymerase III subunit beta [Syntrophomonadaceae bacterium]|nr:DNA polymerase III subunit beta [Bacillota bacterium]
MFLRCKILTLCSADFPVFGQKTSESDEEIVFAISVGEFKKVLRQVIFAVSTDMNKLKFTRVYMELVCDTLGLAASDTYRLADTSCPVKRLSGSNDIKMLVPARPLHEFLRIAQKLTDDLVVEVVCKGNNISIKKEAIRIATRLGSEEYPDTRKIFPTTFEGTVTLNTNAFRQALERAMILTEKSGTSFIDFSTEEPSLIGTDMSISVVSAYGSLKERLNVEYNGSGFRATLNARYLHEWLKNCKGDTVQIQHNGPIQPCVALDTTAPEYRYLVLPIRRDA